MQAWIVDELKTADLGDTRLNTRLATVLDDFSQRPTLSIPAACKGRAEWEGAYRLFDNPRVDAAKVLAPHRDATLERIRQHEVVLLAQDTSDFDLTRPQEQVGGPLSDEKHYGLYAHPVVAFTPQRVPLGTVHAEMWARDPKHFRRKKTRKQRAIQDKESHRWLEGYRQACAVQAEAPDTTVICLSDSEGDVYEPLLEARAEPGQVKARFIVRACQDRCLAQDEPAKLFATVAAGPVLATLVVRVRPRAAPPSETRRRKKARPARQATVTVRATRVTLRGPQRKGGRLEDQEVHAVLVREEAPPEGQEPIAWLLLTDLPAATAAEAVQVVSYYCVRWEIEVFFFVLKQGCKVEGRQVETAKRFQACLAVYLVVAWRVLYVTMQGRRDPSMPCDVLFEEDEWRAAYTVVHQRPAPATAPSLGEMIGLVARLGGHTERQPDRPPGPKVMWQGLQRLMDLAACWRAFGPSQHSQKKAPGSPTPRVFHASQPTCRGKYSHKKPPNSTIYVEG